MGVVMLQMLVGDGEGIFTSGAKSFDDVRSFTSTREPPYAKVPPQLQEFVPLLKRLLEKQRLSRASAFDACRSPPLSSCAS